MEDNLEVDCCPYGNDDSKQRLQSVRFDSGYKSGVESLGSFNLKSEVADVRFAGIEEDNLIPLSDDIQEGVKKLTLQHRDDGRFESKDEGYHSTFKSEEIESLQNKIDLTESENEDESELDERVLSAFTQDEDGDTQLHSSIIHLMDTLSLYLISIVPDCSFLNIHNNYLQTPLHLTVITKQTLLTRKLMTAGAKVDVRDHKGNSPLHIASKEGDAFLTKVLTEPISFGEIKNLTYECPKQAIPQNLEAKNYDGQVCIHLAAEGSHIDVLSVLLSKGANINARDGKSGRTILHYAAESGNMQLLEFLLANNCIDINATTYAGLTPIMLASGRNHIRIVNKLKEKGACYDSDDSTEEEMEADYDDFRINGQPINNHSG